MDKRSTVLRFAWMLLASSGCTTTSHEQMDASTLAEPNQESGGHASKPGAADASPPVPMVQTQAGAGGRVAEAGRAAGGAGGRVADAGEAAAEGGKGAAGAAGGAGGKSGAPSDDDAGVEPSGPPPNCGVTVDKLDLLFMVDNSNSMAGEQAALRAQLPRLIDRLTRGGMSAIDGSARAPVRDLHVGVVSSDMGIPGVNYGGCHADGGDDGRLLHTPHPAPGLACKSDYPAFLSYDSGSDADKTQLANDFACVANLGTNGCGFEQQLEAPFKALWPSVYRDAQGQVVDPNPYSFLSTTQAGTKGRGDVPSAEGGNLGFLRSDSLIAIVLLTDEEDCSVRNTEHLWPNNILPPGSPYLTEDINLRCFNHPEFSYDVIKRYYDGFRKLRPGHEGLVAFSAIVGVPTDLVDATTLHATNFANDAARDMFYDKILNDPRMEQKVDPATNPGMGTGNLVPSCSRVAAGDTTPSTAYPPRRIVQLAKAFGANGMVQSICQDDLSPAVDAVVDTIAKQLDNRCR